MTEKKAVTTQNAPVPITTFSQGVIKGGIFQVSGQGPVDPKTNRYIHAGDVAAQTTQTLENVRAILEAGGASIEDVIMVRVYLTDPELFPDFNGAYEAYMKEHAGQVYPGRTTVFTGLPNPDMLVEIDALAVVG
ncbi:RidA family protein [Actinomycetaceae bacterium MB13-C1-2]|nr:RidA family protein [Actinomycetaceae bacterium MB13-C1-2]